MKKLLMLAAGLTLCSGAHAQDSLQTYTMAEIVVTGQYEPQSISKSVYQVRSIPMERIQLKGATSLQDVLNTELNFRFTQDLALGTSSVAMNGLPGQYVKVLVDGVPVVGKSSGNEIDLNQINVNTIERIEIVEGPMSVAFGADALGGVINIITKKAYDSQLSVSARVQEETVGDEYGGSRGVHNQYMAAAFSKRHWYGKLEGGHNHFGGWAGDAAGRERQWHPRTQWIGAGVAGFKKENLNIYYRLDALKESIYNPGEFQGNQAFDQRYNVTRFMHQLQGEASLSERLGYNGAVAFSDYSRRTQSVNVDKDTGRETLSLGDGQQDITSFTGLTARGTFQYKVSPAISIQPGYDINSESGSGGRLKAGTHTIRDYALFASAEYTPNHWLSLRPGVRIIRNSQYGAPPMVPSINTKIDISSRTDLRISYGRGFRAPSLRELYFDFFDASHAIEGNPDLAPEYSHNINASVNWTSIVRDGMTLQHTVSGFYTRVDDMIADGYLSGNNTVTTYINISRYKSTGGTITHRLRYKALEVNGGFSYTGRYNDFQEKNGALPEFVWSPEANASASYHFAKLGLSVNAYYKYTGELPYYEIVVVDGKETVRQATIGSFSWGDASVQKKLFRYLDVTFGARNLLGVQNIKNTTANTGDAHSSGAIRPIGYGRSYFVTLNFQFDKLPNFN